MRQKCPQLTRGHKQNVVCHYSKSRQCWLCLSVKAQTDVRAHTHTHTHTHTCGLEYALRGYSVVWSRIFRVRPFSAVVVGVVNTSGCNGLLLKNVFSFFLIVFTSVDMQQHTSSYLLSHISIFCKDYVCMSGFVLHVRSEKQKLS